MIKEEREAYNNWLNERELDEQAKRLNGFERYTIDLEKKSDEQRQRITDLEQQLAASQVERDQLHQVLRELASGSTLDDPGMCQTWITQQLRLLRERASRLKTQLAASEAGAGEMRRALESGLESYQIIADFWPHDSVAFGSFAGAFLNWANDAKAALATDAGKAAAERLARYEAALKAIIHSDDNDLGTFAQMCETVAREALDKS